MNPPQPDTIHFEILPATEQDSSTLASIESTANDEANKARLSQNLSRVLFGPPCKTTQDFRAKDLTEKMQTDKSARFWKAVISHGEDKGKVVAWTQWYFYTEPQDIEWEEIEWPAPVNAKAANEVIGDGFAVRKGYMSGKRFACEFNTARVIPWLLC